MPSGASSMPALAKKAQAFSAPLSEVCQEAEEAEIEDEDDLDKSTISNINSMDPATWSRVKRQNLVDYHHQREEIKKKLSYNRTGAITEGSTSKKQSRSGSSKKQLQQRELLYSHDELQSLK